MVTTSELSNHYPPEDLAALFINPMYRIVSSIAKQSLIHERRIVNPIVAGVTEDYRAGISFIHNPETNTFSVRPHSALDVAVKCSSRRALAQALPDFRKRISRELRLDLKYAAYLSSMVMQFDKEEEAFEMVRIAAYSKIETVNGISFVRVPANLIAGNSAPLAKHTLEENGDVIIYLSYWGSAQHPTFRKAFFSIAVTPCASRLRNLL